MRLFDCEYGPLYWDEILEEAQRSPCARTWRKHLRHVYRRLIARSLGTAGRGFRLKTDLFEEATSPYHLLPDLGPQGIGMDWSSSMARAARSRLSVKDGRVMFVVGDLRMMPLRSGSIQYIFSGSSLDHFSTKADLDKGLREVVRVLAPGGTLVISLDNIGNPVVWLRNKLPFVWLNRLGLVPYYVGASYNRREVRKGLEDLGLIVKHLTAVVHAPRAPAVFLLRLAERLKWKWIGEAIGRLLGVLEMLERWPTRYLTGHYVVLQADKPRCAGNHAL
jgi:SAM-dependent methyltransferase